MWESGLVQHEKAGWSHTPAIKRLYHKEADQFVSSARSVSDGAAAVETTM